jgi:hypothetical protein
MGVDTLLPPSPLTGLIGQIKAYTENRTITGEYYVLTRLETFPYPRWDAMVGSKVGYFLPIKANYYCWTNLHP